jgi:cathepsin L
MAVFDWSQHGVVGSVKDQGYCGDCWNFAAVGVCESMYAIRNGLPNLLKLSEEQLLRCNTQSPQGTCCGGWWPFDYVRDKGLVSAANFPYTSGTMECPSSPPDCSEGDLAGFRRYQITAWDYVEGANQAVPDQSLIKKALCDHGPLIAAVAATDKFIAYKPGDYPDRVFQEPNIGVDAVNHAIMIVGWTDKGWIVRNSWGTTWGDQGYILVAYGSNCIGYGAAWVEVDPVSP